nr:hypothetical protein [Tanacetum cinerariifolium]
MTPKKRTRRSSLATATPTTTPVTDEKLRTLIAQGVADVLAKRDATRSRNGEDCHDSGMGVRRQAPLPLEYTYSDFMKCKPLYFKGTEGVIELTQWMFLEESNKIERYVGRFPDMIHESVMASKPKTMQDAIEFATELIDKKINTLAKRQAENKRKLENNNQTQQQPPKKQGVAIAYTIRPGEKKESDCPKLKNQNHGNQAGGTGARGMVHALGEGETNQDLNDMEDDINA